MVDGVSGRGGRRRHGLGLLSDNNRQAGRGKSINFSVAAQVGEQDRKTDGQTKVGDLRKMKARG